MKVTIIEEAYNLSIIKFNELIGSFLTFEMTTNDKYEKKYKRLIFKSNVCYNEDLVFHDTNKNISEFTVMLAKSLSKNVTRLDIKSSNIVTSNVKEQYTTKLEKW